MKKNQSKSKSSKIDSGQTSLFDFGTEYLTYEEKKQINQIIEPQIQISHENHIEDSKIIRDETKNDDEEESNIRSEQIIISKDNYPSISDSDNPNRFLEFINNISMCCRFSRNQYDQSLFEIRQSFFNKIDTNPDGKIVNSREKQLRIDIRNALNKYKNTKYEELKNKNYKNTIYKLLDKYFKDESKNRNIDDRERDNYSWSPQSVQQIIDMSVEAWLDNDLARRDYNQHPEHRVDYTGEPRIPNYIKRRSEYISVFTNQQCKIEKKNILIPESMNEDRLRYVNKNFLVFPNHLNIKPIETRLPPDSDLREVRIIPLIRRGYYKIELVIKKVTDRIKITTYNLDPKRIIGIDTGQENVVTTADNVGNSPIIIKGGILLSINQWFDKIGSKLYSVYYMQQKHKGKDSKGKNIVMGDKMKILSSNRTNFVLDILHKISRSIVNYCINNRIGTIVWGRNPGWKQNINIGKRNNQKFTKIPHYILFKLLKYKAEEIGIKVMDVEESHTSKCSFLDFEPIGHKEKGQYVGKRIKRGLFRSLKGILINADVNAAYNMIRKVFPDAFSQFIMKNSNVLSNGELMLKTVRIEGVVLHPKRLSIKDLLSRPNTC